MEAAAAAGCCGNTPASARYEDDEDWRPRLDAAAALGKDSTGEEEEDGRPLKVPVWYYPTSA